MEKEKKGQKILEALGEMVIAIISFVIGCFILGMFDINLEHFDPFGEHLELTALIGVVALLALYGIVRLFVWLIKRMFSKR